MNANPLVSALALLLAACGSGPVRPPERAAEPPARPPPPEMVEIWSAPGRVSTVGATAIGERTVFVSVSGPREEGRRRSEQRLYAIDRASRRVMSRAVWADHEILRVDPLIVESWDGQRARWLGTRIVRLSDALEPVWHSDPMNMSAPQYATGPLVIVEQVQAGEYVGLDPGDGRVVFRFRSEPDGVMNYAVEGGSFVAVPTEERTILVDRASGEVSGVIDAGLGGWEVIGDRVVVAREDRLIAYDGQGREVWSRAGEFPFSPARSILSWAPDVPPARADVLLVWQRGRGLVAIDEAGADRWVHPVTDAGAMGDVMQLGDRVLVASERARLLDARTGEVVFACAEPCEYRTHDEHGVVVDQAGPGGAPGLALYGYDGALRWRYAPRLVGEDGRATTPAVALLAGAVATCPPGGPLTFLDREAGSVLSAHELPHVSEEDNAGSPRCWLRSRADLVLAATHEGAALFGPRPRGDHAAIDAMSDAVSLEALPPIEEPSVRPLYVLSALAPPADGQLPEAYVRGREAYRRARAAFEARRFEDAARGFIEAYRVFFGAGDPDVQRLGLECCYNARVSVDRAGSGAYDELAASLTEADGRCLRIVANAPPPSRPF